MSEQVYEKLSPKGKEAIQKETREAIQPVVRELTEKFDRLGFRKEDVIPAIQQGIDDAKKSL